MNVSRKVAPSTGARLVAAAIACGVVAGLNAYPASAATLTSEPGATAGGAGEVEVSGREVAAANDPVSITLPGRKTGGEVDLALVPEGEFKGEGDTAALSTTVGGSIISTFGTTEGT